MNEKQTEQPSDQQSMDMPDAEDPETLRREVEIETGALLPKWLSVTIWIVFGGWSIFALSWMGYSIYIQRNTMHFLSLVRGPWEDEIPEMDSEVIEKGVNFMMKKPRQSLLYVIQELLREKHKDPRMERAIVLRKAINWGVESKRRALFEVLLENISDEGEFPPNYELSDENKKILQRLVKERVLGAFLKDVDLAHKLLYEPTKEWGFSRPRMKLFKSLVENLDLDGDFVEGYEVPEELKDTLAAVQKENTARYTKSYEGQKITEVFQWIARGHKTRPEGPEKRRIHALLSTYEKHLFRDSEKEVLLELSEKWGNSKETLKRDIAANFKRILNDEPAVLTREQEKQCEQAAQEWENLYQKGRRRLCALELKFVRYIEEHEPVQGIMILTGESLDHPEMWDMVQLLDEPYPGAREQLRDAVFRLRKHKYILIYLKQFIRKDSINPVMAVETTRMTQDEHEALLRRENYRRRLACIAVVGRIVRDYCKQPFDIKGVDLNRAEQREYFKERTVRALESVVEDRRVGEAAQKELQKIKAVCPEIVD
ncbi:MAG: hypothetical protein KGZ25_11085 [Planctomycetes bacterium]|nr:hypothetical protein [Planctomycetota bacterium]